MSSTIRQKFYSKILKLNIICTNMHKHLFDEITKPALIQNATFQSMDGMHSYGLNSMSDESALEVVNGQENPENLIRSDTFKVQEVILRRGRPRNTERSYFHHQPLQAQEASSSAGRLPSSSTAYIAPTAPSAPVIKRAGRRPHADYSEAELAEWEIKKKA
jgi:hypothetical protein